MNTAENLRVDLSDPKSFCHDFMHNSSCRIRIKLLNIFLIDRGLLILVAYEKICFSNSGLIGLRWFPLPLSHHSNCHSSDGESCSLQLFVFFFPFFFVNTLKETLHSVDKRPGLIHCAIHLLSHLSPYRKCGTYLNALFPSCAVKSVTLYSKWVPFFHRNS